MNKMLIIMEKEFEEMKKNKTMLATTIFIPLLFTIIPIALTLGVVYLPDMNSGDDISSFLKLIPGGDTMNVTEALLIFFTRAMMPFFMMLPAILPIMIASYSVVGEKKNRTLEPLLASPVSVYDIIIGKALFALIPALVATWIASGIYAAVLWFATRNIINYILVPDLMWLIGLFVLAPLIAFLGVTLTIIVSSKTDDPRNAQQVSVFLIIPVIGLFFTQMMGFLLVDVNVILAASALVLVIDAVILWVSKKMFNREEILTRWT